MSVGTEEDLITSLNLALAVSVLFLMTLSSAANASLIRNLFQTSTKASCAGLQPHCFGQWTLILSVILDSYGLWQIVWEKKIKYV